MKSFTMGVLSCFGFSKNACCEIYPKPGYPHLVPIISCLDYCSSLPIGLLASKLIESTSVLFKSASVTSEDGNHTINSCSNFAKTCHLTQLCHFVTSLDLSLLPAALIPCPTPSLCSLCCYSLNLSTILPTY